MKLRYILAYFFLLINSVLFCQHSEIGLFGGTSYYVGELNPSVQVVNQVRPVIGLFYRKNINKRYSYRLGANYGKLSSTDEFSSNELSKYRKLSFSSTVIEGYTTFEFNFLPYQINNYGTSKFSPYVFIGFAVFASNPKVENGNSGRIGSSETVIAPSIPFGMGIKFNFVHNLGLSIEWGMRKTYTDAIDGLPETYVGGYQLSNTNNNDWYSFLGITLNYKFLTQKDICPGAVN
jgi:hypothetical protein